MSTGNKVHQANSHTVRASSCRRKSLSRVFKLLPMAVNSTIHKSGQPVIWGDLQIQLSSASGSMKSLHKYASLLREHQGMGSTDCFWSRPCRIRQMELPSVLKSLHYHSDNSLSARVVVSVFSSVCVSRQQS